MSTNGLEMWKEIAQIFSYVMAGVAAIGAFLTYLGNSRRERAKWAVQLFDKFFEEERYKRVRDMLDGPSDATQVREMVEQESTEFTDYLNFFELVTILAKTKQISRKDLLRLFQYYLQCLKKHSAILNYVNTKEKGFEQLSNFLKITF